MSVKVMVPASKSKIQPATTARSSSRSARRLSSLSIACSLWFE